MKRIVLCLGLALSALLPAQSIAVTDSGIQNRPTVWKMHNPIDGSNIGGTMPLNYGMTHVVPGRPSAMQLYVEGPSWATMMAFTQRQLFFNQPANFQLDFDVDVQDNNGALFESDIMATVPVPNTSPQTYTQFNLSLQDLYSTGQLMNVNGGGSWLDIPGAKPGRLAIGTHHYSIVGGWNLSSNTYGLTKIILDGTTYPVTQNATGHPSTWAPGLSIQFQISNAPEPSGVNWAATSVIIDNVVLQQISTQ